MTDSGSRTTPTPTTPPGEPDAARYIELLEQQQTLVAELADVTANQGDLIANGDSEPLLELLSVRQRVMDRFVLNQDRLNDLNEFLRKRRDDVADSSRRRIGVLVDDISDRLVDIMRRDEDDRSALMTRRDEIGRALNEVGTGQRARQAYLNSRTARNRFADEQG